jgi:hypothetical protein
VGGLAGVVAAAVIGTALYAVALRFAAPAQLKVLTGRLRPLAT